MNFNEDKEIMSFGHFDFDDMRKEKEPDLQHLPILPTLELVLFPDVTVPITLLRSSSIELAEYAESSNITIGVVCQRDSEVVSPNFEDLYTYGVTATVLKVIEMPNGQKTAIICAHDKIKILSPAPAVYVPTALHVTAKIIKEARPRPSDHEFKALALSIKEVASNIIRKSTDGPSDLLLNIENYPDKVGLINLIATHMPVDTFVKHKLLALARPKLRAFRLLTELARNEQMIAITQSIKERTKNTISEQQRVAFLQQQLESIRQELYGDSDDTAKFLEKSMAIPLSESARKIFNRELEKLGRINPQSPDYYTLYSYLETILDLPWHNVDATPTDIKAARATLDADHFGLEKVKERILEQLAVMQLKPDGKAPILCLVGAPGVGKTSLGQSIARSLGRKYHRISLGGLHDEAEIRGHRRTYIGAMPGRIIEAMRRVGVSNPVLLLDEIDKLGSDMKGDPSAALLEVLDPEQNCHFHDNYVDVDFDLSKVFFIATANSLSTIPQPLLDRMEVIDISGYLLEEKIEIARRHLIPRILKEVGLEDVNVTFTPEAIIAIIEQYTSESGVRQLEKKLAATARKIVLRLMSGEEYPLSVTPEVLPDLLGVPIYTRDRYEGNDNIGVVTGLAWTAAGGEILFIESSLAKSKGDKLTLTGNLGDVMKESATIALQYVRAHASELGIDDELFTTHSLHIHVPEGAIPKDGPSAGITMATSIVSALTQRRIRPRLAMTGEITLRGKVLPVGGIKEKILAAKRAGIDTIILSKSNTKDVNDIPVVYREGLTFKYVDNVMEVISLSLE